MEEAGIDRFAVVSPASDYHSMLKSNCYLLSRFSAICGIALAWLNIDMPACARTWFLVISAISVATSTSEIRDSAVIRFSD